MTDEEFEIMLSAITDLLRKHRKTFDNDDKIWASQIFILGDEKEKTFRLKEVVAGGYWNHFDYFDKPEYRNDDLKTFKHLTDMIEEHDTKGN